MRIDASNILAQGGVKIKVGSEATDSLKKGDVLRAEVVSSDKNGTVSLKMENGQSFSAKMGIDVKLSPGDVVLLKVTGKEEGQLSLSFSGVETADDDLSLSQTNLVKGFSDKTLAPYASKLSELNMPVTEESSRVMRDLIAQNPKLSLDEAAFLASNKLTGDESLMKAALATLATGEKTDAMIERLLTMVSEQASASEADGKGSPFTVSTTTSSPLTELLTTIVKSFSNVFATPAQSEQAPANTTQQIITQPDINMQINAENTQENLTQINVQGESAVKQGVQGDVSTLQQEVLSTPTGADNQAPTASPGQVQGAQVMPEAAASANAAAVPEGQAAAQGTQPPQTSAAGAAVPQENATAQNVQGQQEPTAAQTTQSVSNVVAQVLSDIPQFSGTPQSALHRFSEMLLRVAGESAEAAGDKETLTAQLDKLFTKISRNDTDAGARLRDARQELYTRLALVEEAISRAAQPARTEMLMQTQKLMDHVRLLNSIEQFVYMQMPVQLGEERKTADLYVFKRKGGKRADPDNVNILLAIDLEFMGHWESLINIKNKDVSIQMEVPGQAEKDHFNANTVLLHKLLDEAGFKLVSTNIKFSEEETTPLTALSTFDRYTGGKQGIIDFTW